MLQSELDKRSVWDIFSIPRDGGVNYAEKAAEFQR